MNEPVPYTRCGECCKSEPCELARNATGQTEGQCQALIFNDDGTTSCLAYNTAPEHHRSFIRFRFGIGFGVCTNEFKKVFNG